MNPTLLSAKRRTSRYRVRMVAHLTTQTGTSDVVTYDVASDGISLRTDLNIVVGDVVHLDIELLFGASLSIPAHVSRIDESLPGVGIRFYPMTNEEHGSWQQFLGFVGAVVSPDADEAVSLVEIDETLQVSPVRRRAARVHHSLEVRIQSADGESTGVTRDVSAIGLFVVTDTELEPGQFLQVHIEDPTGGEPFQLPCVVRRSVRSPQWSAGVALEIL